MAQCLAQLIVVVASTYDAEAASSQSDRHMHSHQVSTGRILVHTKLTESDLFFSTMHNGRMGETQLLHNVTKAIHLAVGPTCQLIRSWAPVAGLKLARRVEVGTISIFLIGSAA